MGRKASKKEAEEELFEEPPKIETGDQIAMRNLLGDKLTEYFQQNEYKVDFTWDNYRLVFMFIACIFATLSHFNGREFPDNYWVVIGCVLSFGTINCGIMLFDYFVKKDILTTVYARHSGAVCEKFYCRGDLKRFSEYYHVALEYTDPKTPCRVEEAIYVGKLFDSEGYFDEESLHHELDRLVERFEKNKGKSKSSKKQD